MTTALTVSGDGAGEIGLMELGKILVASGFFKDASQHAQAITKVLLGRELGLTPMAAMIGLHVIDGKPSIGSHVIAAGIKKSGRYDYKVLRKDNEVCTIAFFERPGAGQKLEEIGQETFTIDDAKRAGLASRPPWVKTPKAMLFARAIGQGYRTFCPDALNVLAYAEGELEVPDAVPAEHAPAPDDGKPARALRPLEGGKKATPPPAQQTQEIRRPDPSPASPPPTSSASAGTTSSPAPTAPGGAPPTRPAPAAEPTTTASAGAGAAVTSPATPAGSASPAGDVLDSRTENAGVQATGFLPNNGNALGETLAAQPATAPEAPPTKRKPRRD